jgi:hypothetical protein
MGLILRELVGWVLLLMGLNTFRIALAYVENRQVVEAGVTALVGLFVFRGGIQFIKSAFLVRAIQRQKPDLATERAAPGRPNAPARPSAPARPNTPLRQVPR